MKKFKFNINRMLAANSRRTKQRKDGGAKSKNHESQISNSSVKDEYDHSLLASPFNGKLTNRKIITYSPFPSSPHHHNHHSCSINDHWSSLTVRFVHLSSLPITHLSTLSLPSSFLFKSFMFFSNNFQITPPKQKCYARQISSSPMANTISTLKVLWTTMVIFNVLTVPLLSVVAVANKATTATTTPMSGSSNSVVVVPQTSESEMVSTTSKRVGGTHHHHLVTSTRNAVVPVENRAFFESKNANYSILTTSPTSSHVLHHKSTLLSPTSTIATLIAKKQNPFLSTSMQLSETNKQSINKNNVLDTHNGKLMTSNSGRKSFVYSNQTAAASQLPETLFGDQTYQGLVQPAGLFQNPFYMSSHIVDPLLDTGDVADPLSSTHPILVNFMHMNRGTAPLGHQHHSVTRPYSEAFFNLNPIDLNQPENFAIYGTEHEIHHRPPQYSSASNSPEEDYLTKSKRPVAQNMLFLSKDSDYQSYYTPYKHDTINVYAKYLNHGKGYGKKCSKSKKNYQLTLSDIHAAVRDAAKTVDWYQSTVTKNAVETKRRAPYIPNGVLDSKMFEYASTYLMNKKCYNKMDIINILPKVDVSSMVSRYDMAPCKQAARIQCDPKAKYRSIDGSCNNLKMKSWGKSFTCHRRLLPPDYADGVSMPRIAYDGGKLPNARELSSMLLPDITVMDHKLTSMTMAFGQFIIHDITRTLPTANDIKCCPSKRAVHPECMAIDIKNYDDFLFKTYNQTCLTFTRSIVCNPCSLGPREQQNQATHTFDMSHQYGLRLNDSIALRTLRGGKLRSSSTSTYPKEELLPKMTKEDPGCNVRPKPPRFKCFESADGIRASQHPALQALHTVFHRRHNQHTDVLAKINPHWDDEKLYQEARRITIAEQSLITYAEYLPAIFGKKLMKHFRLGVNYHGYTKYDHKLNPSTLQEFIVASGRFGHSQINDQFRVLFKEKKMSYSYSLQDNFFETTIVSLGHSGGILKGMAVDSTEATDPYFVDDIKNFLYHLRKERLGRDLPAFNIQRGRDHAIPGYVYYLDFCFGFKVKGWNDLITFIPKKQLKKLQVFYRHYKDIDLFVGGISERLISGAAFGPTFACINGIQFYNFKYGDRFFFEHGYQSGSFTPAQLDNIKKVVTLSALICHTHPEVEKMPVNAFVRSGGHNPHKPCHTFPELNYDLWMDKKSKGHYHYQRAPAYKPKAVTGGFQYQYQKGYHKGGGGDGSGKYKKAPPKKPNYDKYYSHTSENYHEDPPYHKKHIKENNYDVGPGDEEDNDDTDTTQNAVFDSNKSSFLEQALVDSLLNNDGSALIGGGEQQEKQTKYPNFAPSPLPSLLPPSPSLTQSFSNLKNVYSFSTKPPSQQPEPSFGHKTKKLLASKPTVIYHTV